MSGHSTGVLPLSLSLSLHFSLYIYLYRHRKRCLEINGCKFLCSSWMTDFLSGRARPLSLVFYVACTTSPTSSFLSLRPPNRYHSVLDQSKGRKNSSMLSDGVLVFLCLAGRETRVPISIEESKRNPQSSSTRVR